MKALLWTGAEKMEMRELADPVCKPGEVLIRVDAVGICGSEIEGYLGHNSLRVPPLVMGHEFCGRIVAAEEGAGGSTGGEQKAELAPGSRVVVNPLSACGDCASCRRGLPQLCAKRTLVGVHRPGAFGELVAVPRSAVVPVDAGMSPFRAALAEPLACSLRATRRALERHPFAGALVFGAGGIGLLCALAAKLLGASRVLIADTNAERLAAAEALGGFETANPREEDLGSRVRAVFGEGGLDAVIDAAGFQPTREAAMRLVRPGGTVMNIGLGIDDTVLPINHLIRSEIEVLGSFCYSAQDFHDAVRLLAEGRITEQGWTEVRPLEAGADAFAELVAGRVDAGKIFLRPH
ncbi:zinc-binding dehydrogenase [Paenibacillus ginsengarvi]|uniref:Galactitol-1-phosphate 5-dehydrogenase n=1 Tax=Paenibacillus ginsengarvi TaxID=400777 RepID=A0A3B0AYX5_9BACL|nr:alcohol dehydrogenase catalytic domain-containing protein [Paenibacillus ginsengarvi]RKN65479.1 galactitol-1-phosphate 5-dehydrogenase [Paenibacillus ginsengarvi]